VQDAVARFTDERVMPIIGDCFDKGEFPQELIPEMAEMGLLGSSLPTEYGCAGMNGVSYGLICQELERGDSGIRSFVSVQSSLCMYPIYAYGNEEQRRKWLPRMAKGEGDRLLRPDRTARRLRSGEHEDARQARRRRLGDQRLQDVDHQRQPRDLAIVWAQTDEGIQGFIVEKGMPGFTAQEIVHKMSLRASVTSARCSSTTCACRMRTACRT
jgi:glutaryl-CoA dehydrogenase